VLEGSVRRAGNSLRITAQLIDGATDAHAWAEKYSGTMDDVFAMQERVSRAIVDALQVALTPAESRRLAERPVSNEVAYECLVRARDELYRGTLDALTRGIALLDRGLEVGGENAWLLGTKAELLFRRHDLRPTGDYRSVREGQAIALRALELEPRCAVAEVSLGMLKVFEPPGAVSALPHLRRAVELEPNNVDALIWLAIVEYMLERIDQSAAAAARVATLDPIFLQFSAWPAGIAALGGRFVEADRLFAPFVAAAHVAPTLGPLYANWLLAPMRRVEELGAHALHQARMFPGEPFFEVAVFQYHALRGDVEAAAAAMTPELHDLIWHGAGCWTYWAARGYAVLGDADRALALLERATSLGFLAHDALAYHDPLFESLRPDPRLQALLARIKAEREKLPAI
jgi:tetratricopeptide (TPR) repeat protein